MELHPMDPPPPGLPFQFLVEDFPWCSRLKAFHESRGIRETHLSSPVFQLPPPCVFCPVSRVAGRITQVYSLRSSPFRSLSSSSRLRTGLKLSYRSAGGGIARRICFRRSSSSQLAISSSVNPSSCHLFRKISSTRLKRIAVSSLSANVNSSDCSGSIVKRLALRRSLIYFGFLLGG